MNLEALYESEAYNDYLITLSRKNLVPFDELRQEVFTSLLETPRQDIYKLAKNTAMQMKRADIRLRTISLDCLACNFEDSFSVLWEARHVLV